VKRYTSCHPHSSDVINYSEYVEFVFVCVCVVSDIMNERAIRLIRTYFPQTKLIVGLRHPIYMIESFYNFRIQNGYEMPPLEKLLYHNVANQYAVSWSRAEYQTSLMYLGKTNLTSSDELALMPRHAQKSIRKRFEQLNNVSLPIENERIGKNNKNGNSNKNNNPPYPRVPNPVFLYETAQLGDENTTRMEQFVRDVTNYLGLSSSDGVDLPPIPRHSPGKKLQNATLQAERDAKKIRICDERYAEQRKRLLTIGSRASQWILNYFLSSSNSHDVFVSNPQHFRQILEGYSIDPCIPQKSQSM